MKSVLVYTVHKAASTFLHQLNGQIARGFGIPHYSVNYRQWHTAIGESSWARFIEQQEHPACFGPIRGLVNQHQVPENLDEYSIVLHLRDPRDVLTSMYFSLAFSHCLESGRFNPSQEQRQRWRKQGVDRHVLGSVATVGANYRFLLDKFQHRSNVVISSYEQMVADYGSWLDRYLGAFRHLPVPVLKWREQFIPDTIRFHKLRRKLFRRHRDAFSIECEDQFSHKRRVSPGDHLDKLAPETLEVVNRELDDVLQRIGCETESCVSV